MSEIKPLVDTSLIQLCNESGVPIEGKKTISEANQEGLWHLGVHVVVVDKVRNSMLIQKRSPRMFTHPSLLELSVGGALKYRETFEQAALREVQEETGIQAMASDLQFVSDYRYNHHFAALGIHSKVIAKNYILFVKNEPVFRPEDEETSSAFYISYEDATQLVQNGHHPTYGRLAPDRSYYQKLFTGIQPYI